MDGLWEIANFFAAMAVIAASFVATMAAGRWIFNRTIMALRFGAFVFLCRGRLWEADQCLRIAIYEAKRKARQPAAGKE